MNVVIRTAALTIVCLGLLGCGGAPSAAAMKRYALRNAPDVESQQAAAPPPSTSQPAASPVEAPSPPAKTQASDPAAAQPPASSDVPPAAISESLPRSPEAAIVKAISRAPPAAPSSPSERRQRSLENLQAIGRALTAYIAKQQRLPPAALANGDGEKMLSWRVAILPELGYPELKARFRPGEPWDSAHNKPLLSQIPPEYQSPERLDTKTNYLGITGIGMAFGTPGGLSMDRIEDGADNTIAVMEVDDRFAHEWTRPVDFAVSLEEPGDGVGALRGDGVFALLASGRTVLVPRDLPVDRWAALYTPARGERINAAEFLAAPIVEQAASDAAAANGQASLTGMEPTATAQPLAGMPSASHVDPRTLATASAAPPPGPGELKAPIPDEESLASSRALLKELYQDRFAAARTIEERSRFVAGLLNDAAKIEEDASDYYELLRIARDMASSVGDVPQALAAQERLAHRFELDPLTPRLKILSDIAKCGRAAAAAAALPEVRRLIRDAHEADRYEIALQGCDLALPLARLAGDRSELRRWQAQRPIFEQAQVLHDKYTAAVTALQVDGADAAAHEEAGKYLCFVKNRWEAGLSHLARGADIQLRVIAGIDMSSPRSPQENFSLGDQYWELAARARPVYKRGLHLRAVTCYRVATAELPGSLEKIKAQKRIQEAAALYGAEEIEQTAVEPPPAGD